MKSTKVINLLLVVCLVLAYNYLIMQKEIAAKEKEESLVKAVEKEVESQRKGIYKDGAYEGQADGFGGPILVNVVIEEGAIKEVFVTDHAKEEEAYYSMAKEVIKAIVDSQSAQVDTVSGATFSSKGIIGAVEDALTKAQ